MKTVFLVFLGAIVLTAEVSARGRVFNRFSPEILANLGYGGQSGIYRGQPFYEVSNHLFAEKVDELVYLK